MKIFLIFCAVKSKIYVQNLIFLLVLTIIEEQKFTHKNKNMTLEICSQKLLDTLNLNPANTNASQLTTLARGAEKSDCVSKMGGFSKITTFIEQNSEHGAPNREKTCDARLVEQYNINRSLKSNLSKLSSFWSFLK